MFFDTIAAISTAPGEAGIGIIRISGNDAIKVVSHIFKSKKNVDFKNYKSHTIHYGNIIDPENGEIYDEVLVSVMKKPNTYTKEDIVEINCHGGFITTSKILELTIKYGARLAEPGEFTKRAFMNGRIDLSQAEAVIDIIKSKTVLSNKYAQKQLEGDLKNKIYLIKEKLVGLIAHIYALMDFSEEDIELFNDNELLNGIKDAIDNIDILLSTSDSGRILREGLKTAIIGKPNVGKSSLLNALLKENRAIVTEIPGTTRDIIIEYLNIKGIPVKLIDTAGIRKTEEIIEGIGVERSKEVIKDADLIILIFDSSRPLSSEDYEILNLINNENVIYVLNKIDLPMKIDINTIKKISSGNFMKISTKENIGLEELEDAVYNKVFKIKKYEDNDVVITNMRHKDALYKAKDHLLACLKTIEDGLTEDFVSIDLSLAIECLGLVTGETASEDLINEIFKRYCVGK
ncbi:tRNA uridine-5-carboxymethylaminomethyl(34) synthesis GTPase MnmE [Aceticella autotrophica]|uniref:tRNA modification GTPase MnmE n=1 Tax=Aceticella autotrophica TaxID=2755338 RepID=A0A975AVR6_9THEO|nr:tRNA uridine-5-carboxymethylaminomethyl(34) synthesis GTPase MnmE [Aceticella autotrophica]QSZ27364.1 tRNA uridine-5-carboxymethylaminomethyl(34) synthesis GTPase MnmE [Aceticella autotrophica]